MYLSLPALGKLNGNDHIWTVWEFPSITKFKPVNFNSQTASNFNSQTANLTLAVVEWGAGNFCKSNQVRSDSKEIQWATKKGSCNVLFYFHRFEINELSINLY